MQLARNSWKISPARACRLEVSLVGTPRTKLKLPAQCLDLRKPWQCQHNDTANFPIKSINQSVRGVCHYIAQLACLWVASCWSLSLHGTVGQGFPSKKMTSFTEKNASLCDPPVFLGVKVQTALTEVPLNAHPGCWLVGSRAKRLWSGFDMVFVNPDMCVSLILAPWCREHRIRHNWTPLHKPIVFIVFLVL